MRSFEFIPRTGVLPLALSCDMSGFLARRRGSVPFELDDGSFRHSHHFSFEGTFHVDMPRNTPN